MSEIATVGSQHIKSLLLLPYIFIIVALSLELVVTECKDNTIYMSMINRKSPCYYFYADEGTNTGGNP